VGDGIPLSKGIGAAAEEFEEAEVAEDLELLADFVGDVGVVGVELGEFGGVGVDVGEREIGFVQGAHDGEDVRVQPRFSTLSFSSGRKRR
jgi:hypothetical protein